MPIRTTQVKGAKFAHNIGLACRQLPLDVLGICVKPTEEKIAVTIIVSDDLPVKDQNNVIDHLVKLSIY